MVATHDRIPWVNLPIFPAARKPSMGHFSPDREPRMSNVPISAPVADRLSESLRSHRCQEGEGLRAVTIVRPRRGLLRRDVKRRGAGLLVLRETLAVRAIRVGLSGTQTGG